MKKKIYYAKARDHKDDFVHFEKKEKNQLEKDKTNVPAVNQSESSLFRFPLKQTTPRIIYHCL